MVEDIGTEEVSGGPPCSNESYTRLFVVAQNGTLAGSSIYSIKHPRNSVPVAYRIGERHCDEVLSVGDGYRSWFYGDSVVGDGSIRLFSPVHPLFLVLPYLLKNKSRFMELDEILCDKDNSAISILVKNNQLLSNINKVADSKKIYEATVYRFNEERFLKWITGRFERLRTSLLVGKTLHKAIIENIEMNMKRKANDDYDESINEKLLVKKPKESIVLRKLQHARNSTRYIDKPYFFTRYTG
uniref:RNase_H2-Ydr279 domain-containing protein n=1 Tax=Heterorhabditis bacteriophora TaxID=37862 RepID=A0A1I7WCT4_HETBA